MIDISLIEADWLEYKKIEFRSKHSANPDLDSILKISFNDHVVSFKAGSKSVSFSTEYNFEAESNSYNARGNLIVNSNSDLVLAADAAVSDDKIFSIRGHLKDDVNNVNNGNDVALKIDVRGQTKINFVSNAKTVTVEVVDIFRISKAFRFTVSFEEEAEGMIRLSK